MIGTVAILNIIKEIKDTHLNDIKADSNWSVENL
jgi:hypothetical protein